MKTFVKTQLVLIIGSIADFLLTFLLVDIFNCWYLLGNAIGNINGGLVQFILSLSFVFTASTQRAERQLWKFILMWLGNIGLSALGVYAMTQFLHSHYLVSKLFVSVLLGVTYTYFVSKRIVFQ